MNFRKPSRVYIYFLIFCMEASHVFSCTRIFWWDNPYDYIVGRTMDWMEDTHPEIWVYPPLPQSPEDTFSQKKTYGMLALTAYGTMTGDGINDEGLAGHVLYLGATAYNATSEDPATTLSHNWLHSVLQSYASVSEAIHHAAYWRIAPSAVSGHAINIHLALEDKTGDSAILEYEDGALHIFHGSGHGVLTNAPFYEEHLHNLKKYTAFGGTEKLPYDNHSIDRFVKTTYSLSQLSPSQEESINAAQIKKLLTDVSVHQTDKKTYYHTLTHLSKKTLLFHDLINDTQQTFSLDAIAFDKVPPKGEKLYPLG